jgi:hypothetical protein
MKQTQPLIVVGTGRCGTHTLVQLLSSVPGVLALHEGKGRDTAGQPVDLGDLTGLNVYLHHAARRKAALEESFTLRGDTLRLMDACFAQRHRFIRECREKGLVFCDVNRCEYNFINYIFDRYPQAYFVHLVRNGYDVVRSWNFRIGAYPGTGELLKHKVRSTRRRYFSASRHGDGIGEHLCDLRLHLLLRRSRMGSGAVRILANLGQRNYHLEKPVPFPDDPHFENWRGFRRIEKLAWFWSHTNTLISERLDAVPETRKHLLRIEDLDKTELENLLSRAGLPLEYDRSRLKPHGVGAASRTFNWSKDDLDRFNRVAANSMQRMGYEIRECVALSD